MNFCIQKEYENLSGIYKITLENDNSCYIGSAINFRKRFNQHIKDLTNIRHHCKNLQKCYMEINPEEFNFELVEICEDKNSLIETEQKYLDTTGNLLNSSPRAGSVLGVVWLKESRLKILSEKTEGAYFNEKTGKWTSRIRIGGKRFHLGTYETREEATEVYLKYANDTKLTPPDFSEIKLRGEQKGTSKLTSNDVIKIREEILSGVNNSSLSKKYKVSTHTIYSISIGKTWNHVPEFLSEILVLNKRRCLTSEEILNIERDLTAGVSVAEILKLYKASKTTVYRIQKNIKNET